MIFNKCILTTSVVTLSIFLFSAMSWGAAKETKGALSSGKSSIEIVFALDTTGSMSGLIEAAKDKIWSIANTLSTAEPAPEIKIGIVGYRDRGDDYITTVTEMTTDIDNVYNKLMSFLAQGGGDGPESVNQALYDAVTKNDWSTDDEHTYKVIFLVGDAPPHMDYKDDVNYKESCRLASSKGIIVNTIQCGQMSGTREIWKEISSLADGSYFHVSQTGDSTNYDTPYDKEISEKSKTLDKTRIYYGDTSFHQENRKKLEAAHEIYSKAKVSSIAKRSAYNISGSGKANFLGSQELVDAVSSGDVKLEDIKKDELPEEMKSMSTDEQKQYIDKTMKERTRLIQEIRELSEKRQAHIMEQVKKEKNRGKDSLDMKIYNCIKKQSENKGLIYKDTLKY